MKDKSMCFICSGIYDYDLELMNIELQRNKIDLPKQMTIGMKLKFLDVKLIDLNKYEVSFVFNLAGFEIDMENVENEEPYFEIELVYKIIINLDKESSVCEGDEANDETIQDYAWFLSYPTIKDTINSLSNRINLPNLNIPFDVREDIDENND